MGEASSGNNYYYAFPLIMMASQKVGVCEGDSNLEAQ